MSTCKSCIQSSTPFLLHIVPLIYLLISPSNALTCTSQKFTNNKVYATCMDLPAQDAYLHWTYTAAKSSLSIAFVGTPESPNGYVAWAINPTGKGMLGSQALIAFVKPNGIIAVNTYNISSYKSVVESKISFDVTEKTAELSEGKMRIFATLALPKDMTSINQVWQVGPVMDGQVGKHGFKPANLESKVTLDLLTGAPSNANANAPAPGPSQTNTTSTPKSGILSISSYNFGFYVLLFVGGFLYWF